MREQLFDAAYQEPEATPPFPRGISPGIKGSVVKPMVSFHALGLHHFGPEQGDMQSHGVGVIGMQSQNGQFPALQDGVGQLDERAVRTAPTGKYMALRATDLFSGDDLVIDARN